MLEASNNLFLMKETCLRNQGRMPTVSKAQTAIRVPNGLRMQSQTVAESKWVVCFWISRDYDQFMWLMWGSTACIHLKCMSSSSANTSWICARRIVRIKTFR